jgi:hypothetical protein
MGKPDDAPITPKLKLEEPPEATAAESIETPPEVAQVVDPAPTTGNGEAPPDAVA